MEQTLIGVMLMAVTMMIHAIGSARWLQVVGRWHGQHDSSRGTAAIFFAILATAMVLLLLHVVEAGLWSFLFWALPSHAGLTGLGEAVYFSLVTFTTLGYGDITFSAGWRLLGPLEALVGATALGLTTALLFAVIQRSWQMSHGVRS
jgi:voltage-gated potassium channel